MGCSLTAVQSVRSGLRSENHIIEGCATLFESHVDTRGEVENLAC